MRRITGCLPLAAALLVLAGCGDDSDGGSAAETTTPTAEASEESGSGEETAEATEEPAEPVDEATACGVDGAPQVTLTEPGAEPRAPMELAPTAGDSVALDMRMASQASQTIDGEAQPNQPIPAMLMGFEATVDEVTDDEIVMSFVYDKAEFESDDPAVSGALDSMVGLTGTITTTRNGVFVDGAVDTSGLDPMLAQAVGQLDAQLEQLTLPLPTEPVGVGAAWTTTTAIDSNGVVFCAVATYRLTEFDGNAYALETELTQQAEPTTIEDSTGSIEVVEGSGTGSGTSTGSLSFPVAVTGSSTSATHLVLRMDDDTNQGELVTEVALEMQISPRE